MAIFEFVCNECGVRFDALSWETPVCGCGSKDVRRVMSAFAFTIMHEHYEEALGGKVSGATERKRLLKEHDLFDASPKEIQEEAVINEKKKKELDKERRDTLRRNFHDAYNSEKYRGDGAATESRPDNVQVPG